jgi:parallel beta-helix repeat protein
MGRMRVAGALVCALAVGACNHHPVSPSEQAVIYQVGGATGNYPTIQAALNAAPAGETVAVNAGTYGERIVISKPVKLVGHGAVLDGTSLSGTGIGMLVSGATNVQVSGFTVQNFERGIVLQNTTNSKIDSNEVRNNTTKGPPPFVNGVTPWEGVVLIASSNNEISNNFSHDNGHDGLMVTDGSGGNRVHDNRFTDNGAQTPTSFG